MKIPESIEIKKSNNGRGLFARRLIKKGSIIFHFEGIISDDEHTNSESLQIDDNKFLESTLKFDDNLNHSCSPNCYVDWDKLNLISLKDIHKGEELSFNYNTADYDLVSLIEDCSFKCNCGANCIKEVKGFRYLSQIQKRRILRLISPFLKKKFKQELENR